MRPRRSAFLSSSRQVRPDGRTAMSDLISEKQRTVDEVAQRRTLARITGAGGLMTVVVVLGSSLANNYQSASIASNADETVRFFRSIDDTFGQLSSFATAA